MGSPHMAQESSEVKACSGSRHEGRVSVLAQASYGDPVSYGGCHQAHGHLEETLDYLVTMGQGSLGLVSCACGSLRRTQLGLREELGSVLQCQGGACRSHQG